MKRLCIYPSDIQLITGKSAGYARNLIKEMKLYFNKKSHHLITIIEFSEFTSIPLEAVREALNA